MAVTGQTSWAQEAQQRTLEAEAESRPKWMPSQEQIDGYFSDLRGGRILVTGSKSWSSRKAVASSLSRALKFLGWSPEKATLIHGGEKGADKIASTLAAREGLITEAHHADRWCHSPECPSEKPADGGCWQGRKSCRRATQRRNREILNSDGDILLAFIEDGDPGPQAMVREWIAELKPAIVCELDSETGSISGELIHMDSWK